MQSIQADRRGRTCQAYSPLLVPFLICILTGILGGNACAGNAFSETYEISFYNQSDVSSPVYSGSLRVDVEFDKTTARTLRLRLLGPHYVTPPHPRVPYSIEFQSITAYLLCPNTTSITALEQNGYLVKGRVGNWVQVTPPTEGDERLCELIELTLDRLVSLLGEEASLAWKTLKYFSVWVAKKEQKSTEEAAQALKEELGEYYHAVGVPYYVKRPRGVMIAREYVVELALPEIQPDDVRMGMAVSLVMRDAFDRIGALRNELILFSVSTEGDEDEN